MNNLNKTVTITAHRLQALQTVAEELRGALDAIQTFKPESYEDDVWADFNTVESILLDMKYATADFLPSNEL